MEELKKEVLESKKDNGEILDKVNFNKYYENLEKKQDNIVIQGRLF